MNPKSILFFSGLVAAAVGLGLGFGFLLRHEPDFYRRCAIPPGQARKKNSENFKSQASDLVNGVLNRNRQWTATFTESEINSFFEEDSAEPANLESLLPPGISNPRIAIQPDKIRLAFRYGKKPWSSIVSIDLRVWVTSKEPNVLALELQGLHAGSVPISAQSLLERVNEFARQNNIDVTWYRNKGNPVALIRFQTDRPNPTFRFEKMEIGQGWISMKGHSFENSPLRVVQGVLASSSASKNVHFPETSAEPVTTP